VRAILLWGRIILFVKENISVRDNTPVGDLSSSWGRILLWEALLFWDRILLWETLLHMERIPLPMRENTPVEVSTLVRDITPRGENILHCGKEYSCYRKYYCGRKQSFKGEENTFVIERNPAWENTFVGENTPMRENIYVRENTLVGENTPAGENPPVVKIYLKRESKLQLVKVRGSFMADNLYNIFPVPTCTSFKSHCIFPRIKWIWPLFPCKICNSAHRGKTYTVYMNFILLL
jgi:hypothetical protein